MAKGGPKPIADLKIEYLPIDSLLPYARNMNTHSDAHVAEIAASIVEFGWTSAVLIDKHSAIAAGHGRLLAARKLGMDKVPCIRRDHWTANQVKAYRIADNRIPRNADVNTEMLSLELKDLQADEFQLDLLGFDKDELKDLLTSDGSGDGSGDGSAPYTEKIEVPLYEPKGKKPRIEDMLDTSKEAALVDEIRLTENLPDNVREFLEHAAARHRVFNYEQIAEFYAHASPEVQNLMERSALVIIDFNKAIECGFVQLSKELAELAGDSADAE